MFRLLEPVYGGDPAALAYDRLVRVSGLQDRLALSIAEFSVATDVSRSKLYEEIKAGRLKIAKVGRRTLVTADAGLAWLRSREVK